MSYLGKSYHPPGTAPGTLDDRKRGAIEIRLVDYDGEDYVERTLDPSSVAPKKAELEQMGLPVNPYAK